MGDYGDSYTPLYHVRLNALPGAHKRPDNTHSIHERVTVKIQWLKLVWCATSLRLSLHGVAYATPTSES